MPIATFIKSASSLEDWIVDDKTEFCFIGRSNSGKSTLINALANNQIARSSKTPGRTQLVNFFDFKTFRVVDLPGYGYAKLSRHKKIDIKNIAEEYLLHRKNLFGVFQVCDANVLTDLDAQMSTFFQQRFINHFIVLNKIDKQNISTYNNKLVEISRFLGVKIENIFLVSAKNKNNTNKILEKINTILKLIK